MSWMAVYIVFIVRVINDIIKINLLDRSLLSLTVFSWTTCAHLIETHKKFL